MEGKVKEPMVIEEKPNIEESNTSMENITVILSSGDGVEFTVPFSMAKQSAVIAGLVNGTKDKMSGAVDDEDGAERVLKVPCELVSGQVLELMIKYWKMHSEKGIGGSSTAERKKELKAWDEEFVKVEKNLMFELVKGSNYLESIELMGLLCQTLADTIKDMSVEAVREYFGIEGDFTPDEEAKIKEDIKWVFDP